MNPLFKQLQQSLDELAATGFVADVEHDPVNHPAHYTSHPARCACGSGIECIQITEHMSFLIGNVIKYVWRADAKGNALEDLKKARFYLDREIAKREAQS